MNKIAKQILVEKGYLTIPEYETIKENREQMNDSLTQIKISFNSLGFDLTDESYKLLYLSNISEKDLKKFYEESFKLLDEVKGSNVKHTKFYGNFPDFSNMTDEEMYIRQFISYLTFSFDDIGAGQISDVKRPELEDTVKLIKLKLITEKEGDLIVIKYAQDYLSSKVAVPTNIKNRIKALFDEYDTKILPEKLDFKETIVFVINDLLDGLKALDSNTSFSFLKTTTDILRLYYVISNNNVEFGKPNFISLKRKYRRWFMRNLDEIIKNSKSYVDDLHRHRKLWIKAAEKLHTGEYEKEFPFAFEAFKNLRDSNYETWNSKVEKNLSFGDIFTTLILLKQKPGEFARRLDYLLRTFEIKADDILNAFKECASSVSTPVLFQLYSLFGNRDTTWPRTFKLKSGKTYTETANTRKDINISTISTVLTLIQDILRERFSKKENLGKVYISEEMKNYMVPESSREAGAGFHTISTGSRISIPEDKNIVRCFVHWKNGYKGDNAFDGAVDIDLSAHGLKGNLEESDEYPKLYFGDAAAWRDINCYHSGDVRTAPKGASEFIDLDLAKLVEAGIAYVAICESVYFGEGFDKINECFAGFMLREKSGKSGETYDPRTVETKFDLTCPYGSIVSFVVDVNNREIIWVDSRITGKCFCNVASLNMTPMSAAIKLAKKKRISLYELVMLHKDHLELVDNPEEADIKIGTMEDATLTPYDLEKWSSEWM